MGPERAERASAKAAANDLDRILHHLVGGNPLAAVGRVRPPRERQPVDPVHLRLRQRQGRRIDHHGLRAMGLDQSPGVVRVRLAMAEPGHGDERPLVGGHLFIAGKGHQEPLLPVLLPNCDSPNHS